MKGEGHSIVAQVNANPLRFKKDFEAEFGKPENVIFLYRSDLIKIQCVNMEQRLNLQIANTFQGKPITVTLHYRAQKLERNEDYEEQKNRMNGKRK